MVGHARPSSGRSQDQPLSLLTAPCDVGHKRLQPRNKRSRADLITLTAEPGVIGGIPASGMNFGAAINAQAVIDRPYQFDFYDGDGWTLRFSVWRRPTSSARSTSRNTKYGPRLAGAGGFINISQNAKKLVFTGTFVAGEMQVRYSNGSLKILRDGDIRKFVSKVEHVTFSGDVAGKTGRPVLYVTERRVFRLSKEGLELMEIAPGVDLQRDILAKMDFRPLIPKEPALMDPVRRGFESHGQKLRRPQPRPSGLASHRAQESR